MRYEDGESVSVAMIMCLRVMMLWCCGAACSDSECECGIGLEVRGYECSSEY